MEGVYHVSAPEGVFDIQEGESVTIDDEATGLITVAENDPNLERVDTPDEPQTVEPDTSEPTDPDSPTSTATPSESEGNVYNAEDYS